MTDTSAAVHDLTQLLAARKMALRAANELLVEWEQPGPDLDRTQAAAQLRAAIGDPEDWGDYQG